MATGTSKEILTSVLTELGRIQVENASSDRTTHQSRLSTLNPEAQERAKASLLTLHFLFPHQLLPALDILDRQLVNAFRCAGNESDSQLVVYYVQSASAITESSVRRLANSRFRNAWIPTKVHYEVRLDSWNCSCAAFAQSQLKTLRRYLDKGSSDIGRPSTDEQDEEHQVLFGGVLTKEHMFIPICKHILAAVICASAPALFGDGCRYTTVSKEHLAAWSAGYGDM